MSKTEKNNLTTGQTALFCTDGPRQRNFPACCCLKTFSILMKNGQKFDDHYYYLLSLSCGKILFTRWCASWPWNWTAYLTLKDVPMPSFFSAKATGCQFCAARTSLVEKNVFIGMSLSQDVRFYGALERKLKSLRIPPQSCSLRMFFAS